MGAITGTKAGDAPAAAGSYKIITVTATLGSASDTITLTAAAHGVRSIVGLLGHQITAGMDANLLALQVSYSGLVITVVSKGADGLAATDWTGATIELSLLCGV